MMDAGRHPLIEVFTLSEVVGLKGTPGNYAATIRTAARYVDVDLCTACNQCSDVCPVAVPNEFDLGQLQISRKFKMDFHVPVFYYFQLLALAQGFAPEEIGLQRHKISTKPVLERLGLVEAAAGA